MASRASSNPGNPRDFRNFRNPGDPGDFRRLRRLQLLLLAGIVVSAAGCENNSECPFSWNYTQELCCWCCLGYEATGTPAYTGRGLGAPLPGFDQVVALQDVARAGAPQKPLTMPGVIEITPRTQQAVQVLSANLSTFVFRIVVAPGPNDPPMPIQEVILAVTGAVPQDVTGLTAEHRIRAAINREQAAGIIETLQQYGFYEQGVLTRQPPRAGQAMTMVETSTASGRYEMSLTADFSPATLRMWQDIHKILMGLPAMAMEELLKQFEPAEKKWRQQERQPPPTTQPGWMETRVR